MSRNRFWTLIVAVAVCALALPALSLAGRNTVEVVAKLDGKNEVPGPGSQKGKGDIQVFLKAKKEKVCFNLQVDKLDTITAGHIHKGTADVASPVKVTLIDSQIEGTGTYEGCVTKVRSKLIKKIASVPDKFYVNIHTLDYPDGAIRGQLQGLAG